MNAKDRNSVFHAKDRNESRERQRLVRHCLHNRRGQFRTNSVGFGQIHFVLYLLVFSAQGPWVILFSRYRGSCLISSPSVVFASAQSASGGYPVYTQLYSIGNFIILGQGNTTHKTFHHV